MWFVTETVTKSPAEKLPRFSEAFASEILAAQDYRGDLSFDLKKDRILDILGFLKNDLKFDMLIDLFGMDYSRYQNGMAGLAVIYNLYSLETGRRVRLRVCLPEEKPEILSASSIYAAVNWFERETWDMFGIVFLNHPNLTRILCHHDFEGHPLLKEYPADHYQRLKGAIPSQEI